MQHRNGALEAGNGWAFGSEASMGGSPKQAHAGWLDSPWARWLGLNSRCAAAGACKRAWEELGSRCGGQGA